MILIEEEQVALRELVHDVAVTYLSLGLDPVKATLWRQSDVPEVTELTWLLSTVTGMGLLERAHSYKDKVNKGIKPNMGLFNYPILMAADILIYRSDVVPVGKDQKQHLEVTRDVAIRFNNTYGDDLLVIPEGRTQDHVAVIPGLDGRKMSKSYDNTIEIFGAESSLLRVAKARTAGIEHPDFLEALGQLAFARAADRVRQEANEVLAALSQGDELSERLEAVAGWMPPPMGLIESRTLIARTLLELGGLPAGDLQPSA